MGLMLGNFGTFLVYDRREDKKYNIYEIKTARLQERIECIESQKDNTDGVLHDFIYMLNRLQANPTDKGLQMQSKDMITMMGVRVIESEEGEHDD